MLVKQDNLRWIDQIPKNKMRSKIILFGRGPSVDNLKLNEINHQDKYDTFAIADAIKLLDNPTYSINYHCRGLKRIINFLDRPKYLLLCSGIVVDKANELIKSGHEIDIEEYRRYQTIIENKSNIYFFEHKLYSESKMRLFFKDVERTLYRTISLVGAIHFLISYMKYKNIYYIGFDGGQSYGKLVSHNRKKRMWEYATKSYDEGWNIVKKILKHRPDISFQPLKEFIE